MEKRESLHIKKVKCDTDLSLPKLQNETKNQEKQIDECHLEMDEIKLQRNRSDQSNKEIMQSIERIENEGALFAAKLEEEKRKHEDLTILVEHYEKCIYQAKLAKKQEKHKETDESQICTKKLKDKQKSHDSLIMRTNSSVYEISKKVEQVNTLRSERTIFSGVFDQIEKEMFDVQLKYKKALIERLGLQKKLKEKSNNFQQIQRQANKQFENNTKVIQKTRRDKLGESKRTTKLNTTQKTTKKEKQIKKNKKINEDRKQVKKLNEKDYEKMKYEIKVKQILNQLCVKKLAELEDLLKYEEEIEKLYDRSNQIVEEIFEYQEELKTVNKTKKMKKAVQKKIFLPQKQNLEELVQKQNEKKQKIKQEISQFDESLKNLVAEDCDGVIERVVKVDQILKQIFPHEKLLRKQKEEQDEKKLNEILNMNKTSKNTTRIYTEAEFLQISKKNLHKEKYDKQASKNY